MNYSNKLKDPRWQKRRLEILNRDNFKCKFCGDDKTELQIHHLKYKGEPWEAPSEFLETLCKDCHHLITFNKNLNPIKIIKVDYKNDFISYYVEHIFEGTVVIDIIDRFCSQYSTTITFIKNGEGINNLIKLNNG